MYMCWPVLVPQITGGEDPPGTTTEKLSASHRPLAVAAGSAAPPGSESPNKVFATVVVAVVGSLIELISLDESFVENSQ